MQPGKAGTCPAELTVFFHCLSALQPDQFADRIMTACPGFITRATASDTIDFAP